MKIINSHYIPLPMPHNVIMSPDTERVAEQIGVLSVVEEAPTPDNGYGIITHEHPVVRTLGQNAVVSEDKENINFMVTLEKAEGNVWYHLENKECFVVRDEEVVTQDGRSSWRNQRPGETGGACLQDGCSPYGGSCQRGRRGHADHA